MKNAILKATLLQRIPSCYRKLVSLQFNKRNESFFSLICCNIKSIANHFYWMSFMLVFLILCKREFLLSNWIIKCLMCYKNESLHTHNIVQWCMLLMWCNVDLHLSWKEACYRNNTSVILCLYIYVSKNKLQPVFLYVIYCILQLSNLKFFWNNKCVGLESISC